MKKFSFVILYQDQDSAFLDTLNSLNYQEGYAGDDFEVIVLDMGLNQSLFRAINGINKAYELNYIFLGKQKGLTALKAFDLGWRSAKGSIILFMDPYTIVKKDYLYQIEKCHYISGRLMVVGVDTKSKEIMYLIENFSYNMSHCKYPWFLIPASNISIHKDWLLKVGGFSKGYDSIKAGFIDLAFRLSNEGVKIVLSNGLKSKSMKPLPGNKDGKPGEIVSTEDIECLYINTNSKNIKRKDLYKAITQSKLDFLFYKDKKSKTIVFEYRNKLLLQELKNKIVENIHKTDICVNIHDYVKDTELEIWIQILGSGENAPKYYPGNH